MGLRRWASVVAAVGIGAGALVSAPATGASARTARAAVARPYFGVEGTYTPLVGDFNGDGPDDIFWYAPGAAADSVWFGHANEQFSVTTEFVYASYKPAVLDADGDGRDDILWFTHTGNVPLWLGNADGTFTIGNLLTPGPTFAPITGDFNGDGHDDIIWDAPLRGKDYEWLGNGSGGFSKRLIHINGDFRHVVADFNGDGRDDLYLWDNVSGSPTSYIGLATSDGSFTFKAASGAPLNTIPFALNMNPNHDLADELFFYGPGAIPDSIWFGSPWGIPHSKVTLEPIFGADYMPFSGDFDDNRHDDVFWYAPGATPDVIWFDVEHDTPWP